MNFSIDKFEPQTFYKQNACVVFPSERDDLFYMNMRVYKITKAEGLGQQSDVESRLIWCAVYEPHRT